MSQHLLPSVDVEDLETEGDAALALVPQLDNLRLGTALALGETEG